ncbi:MAG: hypothetical protein Kow0031_34260 [Anaerolineae bacterium]
MTHNQRRRGTALLETERGILLVLEKPAQHLLLPGGGAEGSESRLQAAVRELREETGLEAYLAVSLFRYRSQHNDQTVYYVKASGTPKLRDADYIGYYKNGQITPAVDGLPTDNTYYLSNSARAIIGLYRQLRTDHPAWFEALDQMPPLEHYNYQQSLPPLADG